MFPKVDEQPRQLSHEIPNVELDYSNKNCKLLQVEAQTRRGVSCYRDESRNHLIGALACPVETRVSEYLGKDSDTFHALYFENRHNSFDGRRMICAKERVVQYR